MQIAAFLGHGSPMNTLETNRYTASWRRLGASMTRPRALLVISAHWYIDTTAVTAMERPRTIHDFRGFPPDLFAFQYPAPGAPDVAAEVAEIVKPTKATLDPGAWGLDHGTWSVLAHVFPAADVPVVQLSINANLPFKDHVALGARLAPLRDRGVAILGSGNVVHNLGLVQFGRPDFAFPWATEFDDAARALMTDHPADIAKIREHPSYKLAAPTDEHLIPLLYIAGLAAAGPSKPQVLVDGAFGGSLTMTSYTVDAALPARPTAG